MRKPTAAMPLLIIALNLTSRGGSFQNNANAPPVWQQRLSTAMSYDILLCDKSFLRNTIGKDFDDDTNAPVFPRELIDAIKQRLISFGYSIESESRVCTEFIHPNEAWGLQVSVSSGEIGFGIPYWDDADAAIAQAKEHARALANEFDLGLTDQQDGEIIC